MKIKKTPLEKIAKKSVRPPAGRALILMAILFGILAYELNKYRVGP
jgi:hypothetical protein